MKNPVFLIIVILFPLHLIAGGLDVDQLKFPLKLGDKIEVYSQKDKALNFEEVQKFTNKFRKSQQKIPSFGFNQSGWGKVTISNGKNLKIKAFIEHNYVHTDEVVLFQKNKKGEYHSLLLGDNRPYSSQIIPHRFPLFPIIIWAWRKHLLY